MFAFLPRLYNKFFPEAANCAARRREARYAKYAGRRRQAIFVRPRLEALEERIVPDAYSFSVAGNPSSGAYTNGLLWTDLDNALKNGTVPGTADTADIPIGAVCILDSSNDHQLTGLSVEGSLTTKSMLTVSGATAVAATGLLDVTTPDMAGVDSTLETSTLTTLGAAAGTTNFAIDNNAEVDIDSSATLAGITSITGGVLKAKNIDGFSGASITISGTASVTAGPLLGNLVAGPNASFTFTPTSTVTLGAGATLGDGQFYLQGALTVNEDIKISLSEFTLQGNGSIGGSGAIDWWNQDFNWQGGTIGGLSGGGFTIDAISDFQTSGSDTKYLATTMTNLGSGTADFDGTGWLVIDGAGMPAGTGALINLATPILPMEMSLPLMVGQPSISGVAGMFTNAGYLEIGGIDPITISAPLDNTAAGVIECATAAGDLTLSDMSGTSILDGKIGLNNDSLTISGKYTTDLGFEEEFSANDSTTLTGTLTIDSGASADFDHLILTIAPFGTTGGLITGGGDLSINDGGVENGDYLDWINGSILGSGDFTIGTYATLTLMGSGTLGRDLDVDGKVECTNMVLGFSCGSGTEIHVEIGGVFDDENGGGSYIPTLINDGTVEVGAGDTLGIGTFTQSSKGTLQSNLASDTSYGVVNVSGTATLDGTLDGNLENGYQPSSGTNFDVLNFASSSGQFATIEPQDWSAQYNSTSVDLVSS